LNRILTASFPGRRVAEIQPLAGGLRNANFKLRLASSAESLVLRIYEHDSSLCRKELDLYRPVGASVPVPQVVYAEPTGWEDLPPFTLARYVEGISFLELKRSGDREAIAQAAHSAGVMLAAIGEFSFPSAGWLGPGPTVGAPLLEGRDSMPRFVDLCLAAPNLQRRVPVQLRERVHAAAWLEAGRLAGIAEETRLVHGDSGRRNLLVRCDGGRWSVAGVLDWEFAVSGSPLGDVGSFLRFEHDAAPLVEPHFSAGYLNAGGTLPVDWRRLARAVDLTALCESLTHEALPPDVELELVNLVRASIENC
jgi:aminoglycoside phosphotransferase (APT) family kinase protein